MEANKLSPKSLSPETAELLSLAALFTGGFSIDWIVELTGQRASEVLSALEDGERKGCLAKKKSGTYAFRDPAQKKHWEGKISAEEKKRLHQMIAELFSRELPEGDEKALFLAEHLLHLKNETDGCRWLIRAGEAHRKAFRNEEAFRCYEKVLEDLGKLTTDEADSLFIEAAIQFSRVSSTRADAIKALPLLQEAMNRSANRDQKISQALLDMHIAKNEWLRSQYDKALSHFEKGWSLAKALNDPELLRSAYTFGLWFLFWQGKFREAVQNYEKFAPDIHKFPQRRFSLLSTIMVAHCYALTGQVTQGLGMLDAIQRLCRERGDRSMAAQAAATMGAIMLDNHRFQEALHYLEPSLKEGIQEHNEWVEIWVSLMLARVHFWRGEKKRTLLFLRKFLEASDQAQITVRPYPYFIELCWAAAQEEIAGIPGLSLPEEISKMLSGSNVFTKGVAYRYQALLQKIQEGAQEEIYRSLQLSLECLQESGHQIELAKSQIELGRHYLIWGETEKARLIFSAAAPILTAVNPDLIPDDLRGMTMEQSRGDQLLKEILKLGQEVVSIRGDKDLVQHIISSLNRIAGAERGAIFLLDDASHPPKLRPRATKNLTSEQIAHSDFRSSWKMIEEVAQTGKGRISAHPPSSSEAVRSRICVPMVLKDKVVGVLYHDNRLLSSVFQESDLDLLTYFGAMAAFSLENVRVYAEIQKLNQKLREEKQYYEEEHLHSVHFEDIVGQSPAILGVLAEVEQVASASTNVLILGETGAGKELVARAIHRHSPRRDKPFIRVLCSSLPDSLIPSELFGHEKGAFTGAIRQQIGRFELADGGTLLLDEIGDLPLEVQVRLLRVLQTKEFERVGGHQTLRSDFRLLAATNRDLEKEVREQKFRADLYYRLNVFPIYVPPLRERKEDIPLLAHYFLKIYGAKMSKVFEKIPEPEMEKLVQYEWPGNVRELENIIERGMILSREPHFQVPMELTRPSSEEGRRNQSLTMKENERRHILWILQKTGWKVRGGGGAAELLEMKPSTLASRMLKLGIQRPNHLPRKRGSGNPTPLGMPEDTEIRLDRNFFFYNG